MMPKVVAYLPPNNSDSYLINSIFNMSIETSFVVATGILSHMAVKWALDYLEDRDKLEKIAQVLFGSSDQEREWGMIPPDQKYYGLNEPPYYNADKALKRVWLFLTRYYERNLLAVGGETLVPPSSKTHNRVLIGSAASNPESKELHDILEKNYKMVVDDLGKDEAGEEINYIKEDNSGKKWSTKKHSMYYKGKKLRADLEPNPNKKFGYDYLLISRVPNLFGGVDKEEANDILQVAGLQSVGTGGANFLFSRKEKLIELYEQIRERDTKYFQALYKVIVIRGQENPWCRLEYKDVELVDNRIHPLK